MSAINSLSDSSDSDDTMGNFPEKERDPSSIEFSFLKTGYFQTKWVFKPGAGKVCDLFFILQGEVPNKVW